MATRRVLEPAMEKWLDKKLASNGLAQKAIEDKDARTLFLLAAECCVGIREVGGNNRGPMVKLLKETVGGGEDASPWCMSGVQTCLAYAEKKTGKKSPVLVSEHCQSTWNGTPKSQRVKLLPLPGAIGIWADIGKSTGHTCIVRGADQKTFLAVEFNTESGQSPSGEIERDGGGVYHTQRSYVPTKKRKLLGFVKPF